MAVYEWDIPDCYYCCPSPSLSPSPSPSPSLSLSPSPSLSLLSPSLSISPSPSLLSPSVSPSPSLFPSINCDDCPLSESYTFTYPAITNDYGYGCYNPISGCPAFAGEYTLDYQGFNGSVYWWQSAVFNNGGCEYPGPPPYNGEYIWQLRISGGSGYCNISLVLGRAAGLENNPTISVYDLGAPAVDYYCQMKEDCSAIEAIMEGVNWTTCHWEEAVPFDLEPN